MEFYNNIEEQEDPNNNDLQTFFAINVVNLNIDFQNLY